MSATAAPIMYRPAIPLKNMLYDDMKTIEQIAMRTYESTLKALTTSELPSVHDGGEPKISRWSSLG